MVAFVIMKGRGGEGREIDGEGGVGEAKRNWVLSKMRGIAFKANYQNT